MGRLPAEGESEDRLNSCVGLYFYYFKLDKIVRPFNWPNPNDHNAVLGITKVLISCLECFSHVVPKWCRNSDRVTI